MACNSLILCSKEEAAGCDGAPAQRGAAQRSAAPAWHSKNGARPSRTWGLVQEHVGTLGDSYKSTWGHVGTRLQSPHAALWCGCALGWQVDSYKDVLTLSVYHDAYGINDTLLSELHVPLGQEVRL
jgi:hypothetical protein